MRTHLTHPKSLAKSVMVILAFGTAGCAPLDSVDPGLNTEARLISTKGGGGQDGLSETIATFSRMASDPAFADKAAIAASDRGLLKPAQLVDYHTLLRSQLYPTNVGATSTVASGIAASLSSAMGVTSGMSMIYSDGYGAGSPYFGSRNVTLKSSSSCSGYGSNVHAGGEMTGRMYAATVQTFNRTDRFGFRYTTYEYWDMYVNVNGDQHQAVVNTKHECKAAWSYGSWSADYYYSSASKMV